MIERLGRRPVGYRLFGVSLVLAGIMAVGIWFLRNSGAQQSALPTQAVYVEGQRCAECHAEQYDQWNGSQHQLAMQNATAETVLGDFEDATFSDGRVTSRFFRKDGEFFVHTEGPDGVYADFAVRYTLGIEPLQQYLLALPRGRLQALTVAWDTKEKRWFTLYPNQTIRPGDPLHWTERGFTANSFCIECHTTNMKLNYDLESDSYQTTWDAIDVSCQSCHGPGGNHVQWAQEQSDGKGAAIDTNNGLRMDIKEWDTQKQMETCARCHSRRYPISQQQAYDHPFLDDFMPELLREELYYADGQMLDEVYIYGSFLQSKMYHNGVTCMTCHNPHSLGLRQEGNQLCVSCHQLNAPVQSFPTLAAKEYDTPRHHFHAEGSTGAQCVNCHMPPTTYMVIDPRHDHNFSIPRPDLSLQWGTPNACTRCHTEQGKTAAESDQWAVTTMDEWYGPQWQERPSITGIMSMARRGDPVAQLPLSQLISDPAQPAIVRATGVELLAQYGVSSLSLLAEQLDDPSPLVRVSAVGGMVGLPAAQRVQVLAPLLSDPVRAVRIEAAGALAGVPRSEFADDQWNAFSVSLEEYIAAQTALPDHPEGYLNLGRLYTNLGELAQAETAYQTAVARGQHFPPAYIRLGTFYYQTERVAEAEQTFQKAIQTMPDQARLHYSFGLLLAQEERLSEAATHLAAAAELAPDQPRIFYNYGLLLQKLEQTASAEIALRRAYDLSPADPDVLLALATFYVQQKEWKSALPFAEQLAEIRPNVPEVINLLNVIRKEVP